MNHKDVFKLKVISRPLLKLGNKNAILTSHFMPNSSGHTAILIICLFYESAHLCYVKYLRFTCILNQLKIVTFFIRNLKKLDSRFLSVIFYFCYLSWRVLPPCWWVRHCDWPKSLPPWPIHSTASLNHLDEKYPIQNKIS